MYNVAVIGAGVIGLTSALEILKQVGVTVTIFTSELSPNTTGDISAGLWTPYLLQNTPEDSVNKWAKITQDYILKLWKGGYAKEAGISLQTIIHLSTTEDISPPWASIAYGSTKLDRIYLNKLGKEHNRVYKSGLTFLAFALEPAKFLPYLQEQFITNGGKLIIRKITDFKELADYDVIVNCTGFYSKILVGDTKMQAIRGQVARVKAPWQYYVMFDDTNYIIPNIDCVVLGGTHQEDDLDVNVRPEDKEYIMNGCFKLVPSLQSSEVIKHMVGLRPGRDAVRLELETKTCNGKNIQIVHNYGHGGSGVTLCHGCAKDAAVLVKEALLTKACKL